MLSRLWTSVVLTNAVGVDEALGTGKRGAP